MMTESTYEPGALKISMEGHAGAGEYVKDTVCAALSILAQTLERRLTDDAEMFLPAVEKEPGRMSIFCRAGEESEERCREIFDTVFAGFLLLAENYPQFVNTRVTGETESREREDYFNE